MDTVKGLIEGKTMKRLICIIFVMLPALVAADADDDTLEFYLKKSELVVVGTIVELWGIPWDGEKVVQPWTYELKISDVIRGGDSLKGKSIKFSIRHFMKVEKDVDPLLEKGSEIIVFLKDDGDGGWETADIWFGIHFPSPTMIESLKRLASEEAPAKKIHKGDR